VALDGPTDTLSIFNACRAGDEAAKTAILTMCDYLGYAMVDTAGCLIFSLVTTLLQKFYTDIFHLSPLFIMLMFIGRLGPLSIYTAFHKEVKTTGHITYPDANIIIG
jgi:hypothetical protein